ncbi:hypothetical protein [uncultured Anaerovibrio sp.]|uniref:hypothetical protein n=1 Tax=uncultured Anaerovibrio sp. TaxID=361586 RepID=UPI0026062355|nr:hypothetical protein [uncultured Anaerovibrio sp.]
METKYLCKFDAQGYRRATYLSCEYTEEQKADMIAKGFVEIDEDEWNYYVGNHGMGDNGTGYIRVDGKPVSAPPYTPTKDEKLARLESEYQQEKAKLEGYFNTALLMNDTETQEELKAEMAELADWYAEEKKAILD